MNRKIIVAHPGRQHSLYVAEGLKQQGDLFKYITTIYDKKSLSMWLGKVVARKKFGNKIESRRSDILQDQDVLLKFTFLTFVSIAFSKIKILKKIGFKLDRYISKSFGLSVAKYAMKHNVDAVICFSSNEYECFHYLSSKQSPILKIVDCANSTYHYMKYIYELDQTKYHHEKLYNEEPYFWSEKSLKRQEQSLKYTNLFLAPSKFVRDSLLFCGVENSRIEILPYGTSFDPVLNEHCLKNYDSNERLQFIYVGQITYRKGIHHLLNVFSKIKNADLLLVGGYDFNNDLFEKYKHQSNIQFVGRVSHNKVFDLLRQSDVFIFPSLSDSFSLACIEAFSAGIPVVCTNYTGACDYVIDGENGFVFDALSEEKMQSVIEFIISNPQGLAKMQESAIESSKKCGWNTYNSNLKKIIEARVRIKQNDN